MVRRQSALIWFASLLSLTAFAQPLPETGQNPHEGVASCATSVCHGKVSPDPESTVWLNEYRVWLREDYHSRAYKTLQSAQSKAIAAKLGLPSAHSAKICLDCHADNVASEARGAKFQISDGVGCEACHGGSKQWLESHAEKTTSHADNIKAGMYPTEDPLARANLCLSCHLGTKDKFATHRIMGAGHPRLAFELETFTVNQPRHYEVDADYKERKPYIESVNMWLAGLSVTSLNTLDLLNSELFTKSTLVPELSFYQCHACHHPMDDLRWAEEPDGLSPGSVRLNDASVMVLADVMDILEPGVGAKIQLAVNILHQASVKDRAAVKEAATNLYSIVERESAALAKQSFSEAQKRTLLKGLAKRAADGQYRHFTSAEQIFLAVETLCITLGEDKRLEKEMDGWFETVQDNQPFFPEQFAVMAAKVSNAL